MTKFISIILIILFITALTGCGGESIEPAENNYTLSSPASEGQSSQSSGNSIGTEQPPMQSEVPTVPDSNSLMNIPNDLSQSEEGETWIVGAYGYEPTVLRTFTSGDNITIVSIPEIPDLLKRFAQSRGDAYLMSYTENTRTGAYFVELFFYQRDCILSPLNVHPIGWVLEIEKRNADVNSRYFPYSFGIMYLNNGGESQAPIVFYDYVLERIGDNGKSYKSVERDITPLYSDYWDFTETSMFPTEECIQTLIQNIEASSAN